MHTYTYTHTNLLIKKSRILVFKKFANFFDCITKLFIRSTATWLAIIFILKKNKKKNKSSNMRIYTNIYTRTHAYTSTQKFEQKLRAQIHWHFFVTV